MPKSRGRPESRKRRRPKSKRQNQTEIFKFLDELERRPGKPIPYPVVYHYTSKTAALKILESQAFWATAHDCTEDPGELVSANATVFEVAQKQRHNASGLAARVLDIFLAQFDEHLPTNEHQFLHVIRTHLEMVNAECERVATTLSALPQGDAHRPQLLKIHESLANIAGVMKGDLVNLS
jgi:hypothetical protein